MKKIIDGLKYDTEKATEIGCSGGGYKSDFHHCYETLYITNKGVFFLHGESGALGPYAEPRGDGGTTNGEDIRQMSPKEAQRWLEENGFVEETEKYFDVEEA